MTAAEKRREVRARRDAARFRAEHAHMIGCRTRNCGKLVLGAEWDTPDGFRVRQVRVDLNPYEAGHFLGTVEVVGFAKKYSE